MNRIILFSNNITASLFSNDERLKSLPASGHRTSRLANRHQQAVIDYLIEENRVLKDQLDGHRLRFTDEQRIRLAVKAKVFGRRALNEIETLVKPDTYFDPTGSGNR